jgi:choline dehydrogenase
MDGTRCTGVVYEVAGEAHGAEADAEVVLAGGTIGSAHLLLLSGIGPAAQLRELGIDVVLDLPGVGENLQDHLQVPLIYSTSRPLPPASGTSNHAELLALLRSSPAAPHPDINVYAFDVPYALGGHELPEHGYTIMAMLSRPHSRGTVRLADADPAGTPLIDPNYLSDERDVDTLMAALRIARRIGASAAFAPFRDAEVVPGPDTQDDEAWRTYIRRTGCTQFHPVGTCRMGSDDMSVVDPALHVRGAQGLTVADASVIPIIPSVNINASVVAVAERAAALISERRTLPAAAL